MINTIIEGAKFGRFHTSIVLFISLAADVLPKDQRGHVEESRAYLEAKGFTLLEVNSSTSREVAKASLATCHWIYVEGGNPSYLLWKLGQLGLRGPLIQAIRKEKKPYIGSSAGAMILGSQVKLSWLSPNRAFRPRWYQDESECRGLGLTDQWVWPHFGSLLDRITYSFLKIFWGPAVLLPDGQYKGITLEE